MVFLTVVGNLERLVPGIRVDMGGIVGHAMINEMSARWRKTDQGAEIRL